MKIDVAELKFETGSHKTVPVEIAIEPVEVGAQSVEFDRPFVGNAEIWNAGDRLLVRGSLAGEATVSCSRCLKLFSVPVSAQLEEEFVEGTEQSAAANDEEEEDYRLVNYYQGDEIDLSEPLRDNILLELPMKPLCDEGCQGLCPKCGANLNDGACGCSAVTVADPRFAVLKDLLKPDSHS